MNKCRNCGTEFEGKFCPECGTKYEVVRICKNCGTVVTGKFCSECGARYEEFSESLDSELSDVTLPSAPLSDNADTKKWSEKLVFEFNGNSYSVKGVGVCDDLNLIIPAVYNGKAVTEISAHAFEKCPIVSVDIPDSITAIGDYAFSDCTSLKRISIGKEIRTIGKYAFQCTSLEEIYFDAVAMDDMKSFNYVFLNAGKDGDGIAVTIGKDVRKIPAYLFSPDLSTDSSMVRSISFEAGNRCAAIGKYGFSGCGFVIKIELPESITEIGEGAFDFCKSLIKVNIPKGVTAINDRAFRGCESIRSIQIPDNVTYIGTLAFALCSSLRNINIPPKVSVIKDCAFSTCTLLDGVVIPNSVTQIDNYTFIGCKYLNYVVIPGSVKTIGISAFEGCVSTKIFYEGSVVDLFKVSVKEQNPSYIRFPKYYYTKSQPLNKGNYWHYDSLGKPVQW